MTVKLPFIKWRDGRPRLVHGPRERARGFEDRDLRHAETGAWYSYEEAKAFADKHLEEIKRTRQAGPRKKIKAPSLQRPGTVEDLLDDWLASPEVTNLRPASIASYRKAARALIYKPESRGDAKARRERERAAAVLGATLPGREKEQLASVIPAAIGAPELRALFNYLKDQRGHHMALGAIAALSAALSWGKENSKWRLKDNPRIDMRFDRPAGRVVMIELEEFNALVAAADAMGRPSIGDAIYLGIFTGQRQADRLRLKDEGLVNGRRQFRQSKTGMIVAIKQTPQLAKRLFEARVRVGEIAKQFGLKTVPDEIIIDEMTGRPYNEHTYRHIFAEVRELAIRGSDVPRVTACPSLAFINENTGQPDKKHDQDLRDTCVMLLDRAGNDLLSICDVTGHSYQSAQLIMKHYRARNPARADAAIDKLVAFLGKEGLT
ncbi:hypothetical protein JQ599_09550 [Bradyrhizobium diazoefficiens]|nr:hypothetical protein [Bradyrhizobium diazoefficiens]MBR0700143.1 hypothetical protein [Bradyrhizobium diazoefficiens]MBR0768478.1 hypothetical protein [Bradyrhizobium diazoefficiens]